MKYFKLLTALTLNLLFLSNFIYAQQAKGDELKDFKITIEKTDELIIMKSPFGSAWTELSFDYSPYKPQKFDEYGMTFIDDDSVNKDENLADYCFSLIVTEKGIELKGLRGTAWGELSFGLANNKTQAIDQFGMTKE